jgi:hypothetical protein
LVLITVTQSIPDTWTDSLKLLLSFFICKRCDNKLFQYLLSKRCVRYKSLMKNIDCFRDAHVHSCEWIYGSIDKVMNLLEIILGASENLWLRNSESDCREAGAIGSLSGKRKGWKLTILEYQSCKMEGKKKVTKKCL